MKERGDKKEKNKGKSTWQEGRQAVSDASWGSREENFRGAKLTAKRDKNNEHFQTYFIFGI